LGAKIGLAAWLARNALHDLTVAIHYASCKGRVAGRLSAA
jgi:hypothetical protein